VKNFPDNQAEAKIKAEAKLNSLPLAVGVSGEAELMDVAKLLDASSILYDGEEPIALPRIRSPHQAHFERNVTLS